MFPAIDLERNNNNDSEYSAYTKRRGLSLVRADFNRQSSINNDSCEPASNRNSVFDPARHESGHSGGTKLMNFLKSGLSMSKFKSKSKVNLQDQRQSQFFDQQSSKSEENLTGFEFDFYLSPIRVSNVSLRACDLNLYVFTLTSDGKSIYNPIVILNSNCDIQPVHPSIVNGQPYCFQIIKWQSEITINPFYSINLNKANVASSQITKSCSYNSSFGDHKSVSQNCESVNIIQCQSAIQRNEWIMRIKRHINPNIEHAIRHEDSLKIWIQEAKNLLHKKKYFCEIKLDKMLYGRTTIKSTNDVVFWGEEFEFVGLDKVNLISISIYRVIDVKKRRDKCELVALIKVACSELLENNFTEKWYSPSSERVPSSHLPRYSQSVYVKDQSSSDQLLKSLIDTAPMVRMKARYRSLEILPIGCYTPLIEYIVDESISLVTSLEDHLKVKSKEEFMNTLLVILQMKEVHVPFLADIVFIEVLKEDENLILRGNSMASKAMECYLKIVGEKYLFLILSDMIDQVTSKEIDCEVDPIKIPNQKDLSILIHNQRKLLCLVEDVWYKISTSSHLLPEDLKCVLSMIREKLSKDGRTSAKSSPTTDHVISSCLFLRFICPAIMSPFLFGLSKEYSDKLCINRTFTLVAKCIQSLANFSPSHGKEGYMGFLQNFLRTKTDEMRIFLKEISKDSTVKSLVQIEDFTKCLPQKVDISVDLGYNLADLTYQLSVYVREIEIKDYTVSLRKARTILETISKVNSRFESRYNNTWTNYSTHSYSQSQIPVPMDGNTLNMLSLPYFRRRSSRASEGVPHSRILRSDIEEDFSYIPGSLPRSKDRIKIRCTENYVDFESILPTSYDGLGVGNSSSPRHQQENKYFNENEINSSWNKVLKECHNSYSTLRDSPTGDIHLHDEPVQTHTRKLERSRVETQFKTLQHLPPRSKSQFSDDRNHSLPRKLHSPRTTQVRPANIYRRIKRSNNAHAVTGAETTSFNKNVSCGTLECLDNLSGSEHNSLQSSQSLSSVYQKKGEYLRTNYMSFISGVSLVDSGSSLENMDSSMAEFFGRSSQSLSNSISSNADLDSFVANELERMQLFFQYYHVTAPSTYQGNAVDQYKYRTLDENNIKLVLDKNGRLGNQDVVNYLKSGYRLLKTATRPGQMPMEQIVKSVMEINQSIQSLVKVEFDSDQATKKASSSKIAKTSDNYSQSTQSLPSQLCHQEHQSQDNSATCGHSQTVQSALNLPQQRITVHDDFEGF